MRNVSILLLLAFATFGVWVVSSAFIIAPFLHVGESYRVYLHLVTVPDLIGLLIYAGWGFVFAYLSHRFFTRSIFRGVAVAFLILFFLYVHGLFFPSNFRFSFLVQQLVLAAFIFAVAWFGMHCARRNDRHI